MTSRIVRQTSGVNALDRHEEMFDKTQSLETPPAYRQKIKREARVPLRIYAPRAEDVEREGRRRRGHYTASSGGQN